MASRRAVTAGETLSAEEEAFLAAMASGDVPHTEASRAGMRNWAAFHAIRDANGRKGTMSISAVVALSKCSRSPLATKGGSFRILREAIRRQCLIERPEISVGVVVPKTDEERRQESLAYWRKRAQQSDSLNAAYRTRALAAERDASRQKERTTRLLAERNLVDDEAA